MNSKFFNLSKIWFAIAIVLTTATQLRWEGMPIGPGELMLVIWLIIVSMTILRYRKISLSSWLKLFLFFWSVVLILLMAGLLAGLYYGVFEFQSGLHNLLAYLFVCFITLAVLTYWKLEHITKIGELVLVFAVVGLFPLWIYGQWFPQFGSLEIWYGESRFLGWATNPNQTGILLAPLPFIAMYYYRQSSSFRYKILLLILLCCSTILGVATGSDAVKVAWGVAIVIYLLLRFLNLGKLSYLKVASVSFIIVLCFFVGCCMFGSEIITSVEQMYYYGDQGPDRIALWSNGLGALSISPFMGLGPGAYSGIIKPFTGMECHNTFIDWTTNTGILGFLLLFSLLLFIFIKVVLAADNQEVVAAMTVVIIISLFSYVIRHPIWWFYLCCLLSTTFSRAIELVEDKKSVILD